MLYQLWNMPPSPRRPPRRGRHPRSQGQAKNLDFTPWVSPSLGLDGHIQANPAGCGHPAGARLEMDGYFPEMVLDSGFSDGMLPLRWSGSRPNTGCWSMFSIRWRNASDASEICCTMTHPLFAIATASPMAYAFPCRFRLDSICWKRTLPHRGHTHFRRLWKERRSSRMLMPHRLQIIGCIGYPPSEDRFPLC